MAYTKIIGQFIPPASVFFLHVVLFFLDVYLLAPWVDIAMHFLGGAAVAYTFTNILSMTKDKGVLEKNSRLINFIFIISLVALTAVFWEFFECLLATTTNFRWQSTNFRHDAGFADGFAW